MTTFKIRLKLTGLELEVEGSREDVPLITQNLGHQLVGLLRPATAIVEGQALHADTVTSIQPKTPPVLTTPAALRRSRRRSSATKPSAGDQADAAVDWRHDSAKYGTPKQDWRSADKAMWTLYVVAAESEFQELSAKQITESFNKHFRQAGEVRAHNVQRDLGKSKVKKNGLPLVAEDTTKSPSVWYLTEAGRTKVQEMIRQGLAQA